MTILFEYGFEDGTIVPPMDSISLGTDSILEISTARVRNGLYSAHHIVTGVENGMTSVYSKAVGQRPVLHARIGTYLESLTGIGVVRELVRIDGPYRILAWLGITSDLRLQLYYWSAGAFRTVVSSRQISLGRWYWLELKTIGDAVNGEIQVWVDGEEVLDLHLTGIDNSAGGNPLGAGGGLRSVNGPAVEAYTDDFAIGDTYIGPPGPAPPEHSVTIESSPITGVPQKVDGVDVDGTPVTVTVTEGSHAFATPSTWEV